MLPPEHDRARPFDAALLRAARAALGWSLLEASRRAEISVVGVLAVERGRTEPAPSVIPDRLRRAYEESGVVFFEDALGRGIRIRAR